MNETKKDGESVVRPHEDGMGAHLGLTAVITALTLAIAAVVAWKVYPEPWRASGPAPVPSIATDLGTIGGQSEAEAAGWEPITPAQSGDSTAIWAANAHVLSVYDEYGSGIISSAHGTIVAFASPRALATPREDGEDTEYSPDTGASLVSLDPQTGAVRWYRRVLPTIDMLASGYSTYRTRNSFLSSFDDVITAPISVSPDGEYIALRLLRQPSQTPVPLVTPRASAPAPSQTVAVLSADTGEVVRTVDTGDVVLGHALTDDALLVQTSSSHHPEGGSISSYSLTDAAAEPVSWPSTGWLAGATPQGVMQANTSGTTPCKSSSCMFASVTISDPATGAVVSSYDRVTTIYSAGGIVRLSDGQDLPAQGDDLAWGAARRELIDLSSGAVVDITGHAVKTVDTPSGEAWVACREAGSFSLECSGNMTATGWLPIGAAPDPAGGPTGLRTEPLDSVTVSDLSASMVKRSPLTMEGPG